ncbi:hypothetical protein CANARDRAFT_197022 [[Candida] arabinofermentans NRRL YB-2248]|uniref:Ammonium transporter AmtB-like domain-containing protein n=1 Tax=[Candida] arabinofermentans NRRL YB-2248 TaxID=983967 RepID=A0A1E4T3R4_9ASCO|nr:hypothetical protein CANARDRAFT_197022 [[Candida] arabinofermentans NRRL YB-2248]
MILGISLLYSGLTQRKSAFQQLSFPVIVTSEILILWLCFGYSLSFSETGSSRFLGNFEHVGLKGMSNEIIYPTTKDNGGVVSIVYALYHGLFASVTATLSLGCLAERGRLKPALLFLVFWMFLVYCPVSYWVWNDNGWISRKLKYLDFAGGDVVHLNSGCTGLVYSWFLGSRSEANLVDYRASSPGYALVGAVFMIIGWIGFNCGSLFTINLLSGIILSNTLTCMSVAGFSWMCVDYFNSQRRKISVVGFASGCISGLVAITPCTAYINFWSSFVVAVCSGILCNFATRLKFIVHIDDSLDIAAIHLVGGLIGNLLTAIFADRDVAALGGLQIDGGWINRRFIQLLDQFLGSLATIAYVCAMCFIILLVIDRIPGFHLRCDNEAEMEGMDANQLGAEFTNDYVEFLRRLNPADFLEADEDTSVKRD